MMIILFILIIITVICLVVAIGFEIANLHKIFTQAQTLKSQDLGNPLKLDRLQKSQRSYAECLRLLKQSRWLKLAIELKIIDRQSYLNANNLVRQEIDRRHQFQRLFTEAKQAIQERYFQQALNSLIEAEELYSIEQIQVAIIKCEAQIQSEQKYQATLDRAYTQASQGRFQSAFDSISLALIDFDRQDGIRLLQKIECVLETKQKFAIGLELEAKGELNNARQYYHQAVELTPELTESHIRLATIAIELHEPFKAISYLENVAGESAAYLRGYAFVTQSDWRQADREWQSISHLEVQSQRQYLKTLARRDRLLMMQSIQQFVESDRLDLARSTSLQFIAKFGVDPVVENNLSRHIQPLIETKTWQTQDWQLIATTAEQLWLKNQDISALHNWAVASYYQAQIDPDRIANLISAWLSAIANLDRDPSLQDVPWLENTSPDLGHISLSLTKLLERLIDTIKDKDLDRYLQLRDLYRWQTVALRATKHQPDAGIRVNQLLLSPGSYQRQAQTFPSSVLPVEAWSRLYTDWGPSVAACIEGDLARAFQIQPQTQPISGAEKSAESFITYHQGCHYLQQQQWRKATIPFRQVKAEIKNFPDWIEEIDRLCARQRQEIDNFDEHLEFAQFWYNLVASKPARSYLAEYKALQIGSQLAEDIITLASGLQQLRQIEKIDNANPTVIDLITKIEVVSEINIICALMKKNRLAEGVGRAQSSSHPEVKYRIAEILIDILIDGAKSRNMSRDEVLKLGSWAHDICPDEPNFREIYQELGLCE